MDYDDSDFQSQNFQLGGEDNKFPPGLPSYPLPKFDLDETLHIRFDSLVETEVLLGKENHWIEDFSRGSSGIEFSSSAAESCSISMRNNVWSEATSSESVEMLLKSVGDDEMVNKQHINEESRVCDALNDSDNQMDLSLKQDDSLPSKIEDAIDTDSTLLPDKGLKSSSGSSEDAAKDLPKVVDVPHIEHDDNSGFENLSDLDPCSASEKYETYENITAEHCNLEKNIMLSSVEKSAQDDHGSAAHGMTTDSSDNIAVESMQVDTLAGSRKDPILGARVLNDQKISQEETDGCSEVFCDKSLGLLKNFDQTGEIEAFRKDVLMDGQHCEEPADGSTGEVEGASGLSQSVDISLQRTGNGDDVLIEKPVELLKADSGAIESAVLRKDNEMNDDFIGHSQDTSLILMEGKEHIEHELAASSDNENAHLSRSATTYTTHDAQEMVQINDGHSAHSSPNHSAEDSEFAAIGNEMGDKVSRTDNSNPDFHLTESVHVIPEDAQCLHDLPVINSTELHVSSSLDGESSQSYNNTQLGDTPSDAQFKSSDISIVDKGNGGLPTSAHNSEAKIDNSPILDKCLETSSHGKSAATITADVCELQCEQVIGDSSVPAEDMASISKLEENNQVMNEIVEQKVGTSPVPISDCLVVDEKKESITSTSTEPCASVPDRPNPVSDPGQHSVCNSAAELQPQIGAGESSASGDKSIHSLGQNEPQMATGKCDKGLEELPAAHVPEMKESDGSEVSEVLPKEYEAKAINIAGVTLDCHGETSFKPLTSSEDIVESHLVEAGSGNPTSDEPNCGSPIIISCSEPSESKKDYQDGGGNGPSNQSVSISSDDAPIPSDVQTHVSDVKSTIEDDRSFTFKVGSPADLSERETERGWKPFSNSQPSVSSQIQEGPATSNLGNADPKVLKGASHGSHQVSGEQKVRVGTKATKENKTKSVSGSATEKKTSMQEKANKKSSHQRKTIEKDCSPFNTSTNLVGISRPFPVEELRHYSYVEGSSLKKSCAPAVQASNLPDLNSSVLTMSHQPFTDVQQVQLRAQIFVYGSLIQGIPPDEACMISAFGDGGRSLWENVWRLAVEKLQNQKSPLSNTETPFHSRPGIWTSEQLSKSTPLQGKAHSTAAGRTGKKGAPSSIVSSGMLLPSPVWSISTPSRDGLQSSTMPRSPFLDSHQSLPPLHPYQSPHMRQYVGSSAPWPSQSPGHLPWVVSPQTSSVNAGVQYSALPITEAVQVTPVRDSSVPRASNMPLTPSSPLVSAGGSVSVPADTSVLMEAKRTTALSGRHTSADAKSRKRKKNLMSEELCQISSVTLPLTEPASATAVGKQLTMSVATSLPAHPESRSTVGGIFPASSPIPSANFQVIGVSDMDRRVFFSNETCSRIEQSKLHAEDAAAVAASAVKHCQGVWSQLSIQKSSGLISEVEVKLASAAVAASAAASVAKAAAAAAKVASDAALQAKLMGDEAVRMSTMEHSVQASETGLPDSGNNLGMVSPASILKGNDRTNSSNSVIVAAREAARKRVEAASAATKRAQNLDAVVKAAELAAEAVSQAGIIIAMGEPIPLTLSELAVAGVDGYWRAQHGASDQVKPNGVCGGENPNVDGSDQGHDRPAKRLNARQSSKKGTLRSSEEGNMPSKEVASLPVGDHAGSVNEMCWDFVTGEKVLGVAGQNDEGEQHQQVGMSKESKIMEGSDVEVASDESGLPGVWFSAKVLSLKDGKAYVCHNKLLQGEGAEKLKEWISLEGEGNKAPRIRIAHPVTAMKFEGARKRRRAAIGNYVWSVGDRVDAWMRDGWWEGVVTEKSKGDETKLTVRLTAGGESSIVRPWNIRPSLVWKDGQWTECPRENNSSRHEGDTPQEKRQKLGLREVGVDPKVDVTGREDNPSGIPCNENLNRPEESRSLVLSEKERIFSVGKVTAEDKNSNALKMKRTGLQKEGSRVVFGVPKPGKKRKFMEVSKHYVADQALKMSERTDSIKFAKYLMPQGSHGLKYTPKVDIKGKSAVSLKPKVMKSGKAHVISGKSISEKDNSTSSQDSLLNPKASSLHYEKNKHNKLQEAGSFSSTVKAAEGAVLSSSMGLTSDVPSSQKKSSSAVEMGAKGKRLLSGEKLAEEEKSSNENLGRMNSEPNEPRRSNRRIQPTSRLLEGLQSSLIISKIPPVSHDKGVKAQHRSGISSRGNNRG